MCNSHTWNTNTTQKYLLVNTTRCHKNTILQFSGWKNKQTNKLHTCGSKLYITCITVVWTKRLIYRNHYKFMADTLIAWVQTRSIYNGTCTLLCQIPSWFTTVHSYTRCPKKSERRISEPCELELLYFDPCFNYCHWINGLPQNTLWKAFPRHNSSLICRKNEAKFENDCISRSGHRFKITQPNLMILVSFSSAEDALSNDVKKTTTILAHKVLKIRRSSCLWTTRYNFSQGWDQLHFNYNPITF